MAASSWHSATQTTTTRALPYHCPSLGRASFPATLELSRWITTTTQDLAGYPPREEAITRGSHRHQCRAQTTRGPDVSALDHLQTRSPKRNESGRGTHRLLTARLVVGQKKKRLSPRTNHFPYGNTFRRYGPKARLTTPARRPSGVGQDPADECLHGRVRTWRPRPC